MLERRCQQVDWSTQARAPPTHPAPRGHPRPSHAVWRVELPPEPAARLYRLSPQVMYEEDLGFVHMRRKGSMYSQTQKVLARGKLNKVVAWNDGSALGAARGSHTAR